MCLLMLILAVTQSKDSVGCGNVIEGDSFPFDTVAVAVIESVDV